MTGSADTVVVLKRKGPQPCSRWCSLEVLWAAHIPCFPRFGTSSGTRPEVPEFALGACPEFHPEFHPGIASYWGCLQDEYGDKAQPASVAFQAFGVGHGKLSSFQVTMKTSAHRDARIAKQSPGSHTYQKGTCLEHTLLTTAVNTVETVNREIVL